MAHAGAQLRRQGLGQPLAGPVRLGRRRRRPDPRDAGQGRAARATSKARPRVQIEAPATFFAQGRRRVPGRARSGSGELYLELHRGTYTSQAQEQAGQPAQRAPAARGRAVGATAAVRTGHAYPYEELDRIWKTVLLHQFHDILPGSSIAWVHRESRETYAAVAGELEAIIAAAQQALAGEAGTGTRWCSTRRRTPATGSPPSGPARAGGAPPRRCTPADGGYVARQRRCSGSRSTRAACSRRCSTWRARARGHRARAPPATCCRSTRTCPAHWDAWDVDHYYRNAVTDLVERRRPRPSRTRDGGRGAGRAPVRRLDGRPRSSRWRPARGRVDVDTEVDWHESETLLKAGVPAGRPRRPVGRGDPVRVRLPADPHQHQLGRGEVRDLRAPLPARRPSPATASPW